MLALLPEVGRAESFGERLHVHLPRTPPGEAAGAARQVVEALSAGDLQVRAVRPIDPSLEDVFIHLVRETDARETGRTGQCKQGDGG